jgi:sensor histidine kinase regulating citrate/malate metabolism
MSVVVIILFTINIITYLKLRSGVIEQLGLGAKDVAVTIALYISENADDYQNFLNTRDITSEYYQHMQKYFSEIKEGSQIRYIYTSNRVDETHTEYILDAEPIGSENYTPPGTPEEVNYDSLAFLNVEDQFTTPLVETPYGDLAGGNPPILNKNGDIIGSVGVDIDKSTAFIVIQKVFIILVVTSSLLLVFMFFLMTKVSAVLAASLLKNKMEADMARTIISSGRSYYEKLTGMTEKLRILRHDYKYHLKAARQMLDSGDTEGADRYLKDVGKNLSELETAAYCGNPVINALVAGYAERCAQAGVKLDVNIAIPESCAVDNYDLCIIVGNLMENAIEASEKLENSRMIIFDTRNNGDQLLLMVKNSFNGEIHSEDGMPVSAKTDGGFGLRSVREIISHYGGEFITEWDNNTFTAYAAVKKEGKVSLPAVIEIK